jgi:AP-1 complex subunit mu
MQESAEDMKPVFAEDGVSFVYVKHNNLYLVALTRKNSNVMVILVFLEKLVEIMNEYFGSLEEESIRDNFVLVYELLDEVMDHGYPQIAEVKVLREYITQGAHKLTLSKPPQAVTNVVSWRTEGIKHKKNEVFLDVVEKLNLLVAANGTVLSSEILGSIKMRSFLSGMPELKLGLNDKAMFDAQGRSGQKKAVEMEDIKFHQCVRLTRFETDRTISFIPPDGEFELMSYRLNTSIKPLVTLETLIQPQGRSRLEYIVRAKSTFKQRSYANNVDILIPVPPDVDSPAFYASHGTVTYVPDLECIRWSIRQLPGGMEINMKATFGLPSVAGDEGEAAKWRKRTAQVRFEIPYFSVSGIQVRYLKILEKSGYEALPWVCVFFFPPLSASGSAHRHPYPTR